MMARSGPTVELAAWLESRGAFVHPSLELFGERGAEERGVFALQPIEEGELLLRLPRAAAICVCEDDDDGAAWLPAEARAMSAVVRTSLCLMRERALGPASAWAPYLRLLPRRYDTLENWSQPELHLLRGTSVHDHLAGLRDASGDLIGMARLVYDKQVAPVVRAHPHLWPDASLDAFLDACAAVRTRGFHDTGIGGGGPYMLPAIDMLNHARAGTSTSLLVERILPPHHDWDTARTSSCGSPIPSILKTPGGSILGSPVQSILGSPVESILGSAAASPSTTAATAGSVSGDPSGVAAGRAARRVPPADLFWSMRAERHIASGEEVTHSYDALDNAQLLLCYGFVAPEAEAPLPTSARIPVGVLLEVARQTAAVTRRTALWDVNEEWGDKEAACEALLAPYGGAVSVSVKDPLPDALMTVLQLMMMPAEDFRELLQGEEEEGAVEAGGGEEQQDAQELLQGQGEVEGTVEAGGGKRQHGVGDGGGAVEWDSAAAGGGVAGVGGVAGGGGVVAGGSDPVRRRIPMLDTSAIESEPEFAWLVGGALNHALDAALRRYATDEELGMPEDRVGAVEAGVRPGAGCGVAGSSAADEGPAGGGRAEGAAPMPSEAGRAATERRRRMAVQLVLAEKEALRETRRRGWDLVLTAQQSGQEMEEVESEGEPMSAAEGSDGTEAEAATEGEAIAAKRVRR